MLTKDNIVKLGSFGCARSLLNNQVGRTYVGTPAYMSPEQSKGRLYDEQQDYSTHKANTDIWLEFYSFLIYNFWGLKEILCFKKRSLGCFLYELITLELAFPEGHDDETPIPNFNDYVIFSEILKKYNFLA